MPIKFLKSLFILSLCLSFFTSNAQVTASFTASDTAGCSPLIVRFTNTSTGATSYSWDLGNGSPPTTLTDASGSYISVRSYTVTLTATNGVLTSVASMVITTYAAPTVAFSASPTNVCPGANLTYTSTTVPGAWGGLTYNWNFGDGGSSTAASPVYNYVSPGDYNVTLFATNSKGCMSSLGRSSYIHVFTPPTSGFSASQTFFCRAPATAVFTNTSSGSGPLNYLWRFGDGLISTALAPTHTYTASGSYNASLVVTDVNGCKDSMVRPGYINVNGLCAVSVFPSTACVFIPVAFGNTSTTHISSAWNFGDGGTSSLETPFHTYAATGTYNVRLVVYDGSCYDTVIRSIVITDGRSGGTFTISPANPCPPPITLTYTSSVPSGSTVAWRFGDTAVGSGFTATHLWPRQVVDYVDMIVTNPAGCKDTIHKVDTIPNLTITPTATARSGCVPLTTTFSVSLSSTNVYDAINGHYVFFFPINYLSFTYPYAATSYLWNFGDGSPTSTLPSPSHTYTAEGVYLASCRITTANGCSGTENVVIKVGSPPTASFTMSPSRICADRMVTFINSSSGVYEDVYWDFGDTYSSTLPSPGHVYATPGLFNPSLTISHFDCPSAAFSLPLVVDSPNAVMHLNYTCIPSNGVVFTNLSLGDDRHVWIFGDGDSSTVANPTHYFPTLSNYNVKLATYNTRSGCRDTTTSLVSLARPTVRIYTRDSTICRDQLDTFYSVVTGLSAIRYKWYVDGVLRDSLNNRFIFNYRVRGTHFVQLIITDSHGCFDTSNSNSIIVSKPIANFTVSPATGCAPLNAVFTDISTDVPGPTLTRFFWNFGNGDTATFGVPTNTHTYTGAGTFTVREIITNDYGCRDTLNRTSLISVFKPVVSFTVTGTSVCARASTHFTNTSPTAVSAYWSFGDGFTSTDLSPDHAYAAAGTYNLKMVVTDAMGCVSDTSRRTMVVNPLPTAGFTMSDSFAVCPPLNITFTNASVGAISYLWAFGDGTFSIAPNPSASYLSPSLYNIRLVATNTFGCKDTAYRRASIFGYTGAFTYTPTGGCSPLSVHFSAFLSHVTSIVWDFSDGITSTSSMLDTITHRYMRSGSYLPKLILTDTSGCTSYSLGLDTIKVDTVRAGFVVTPSPVCQNNAISCRDTSSSLSSPVTGWLWTFASGATSTLSAPSYTYTLAGVNTVTLTVTNARGCSNTATRTVTVNPVSPITGVTAMCTGYTTSLFNATPGGRWSAPGFAGIATIGSVSGIVTGISPGTAMVTYTTSSGCIATTSVSVNSVPPPISGLPYVCVGSTTLLTDPGGGLWTSSNTAVATVGSLTGLVYGVTAGTALITYSLGTGCMVSTSITVSPIPLALSGSSAICMGQLLPLSDLTPGGTWSSSNTAVAPVGITSGVVAGVTAGTAVITYSLPPGCLALKTVTINPIAPITGITVVCEGATTALADIVPGGSFTSSNTAVATVGGTTGVVSGVAFGTAIITYLLPTGCSAFTTVTVNPVPAPIAGISRICVGYTTTLSGPSGGSWTSGSPAIATIHPATGFVTGVIAGTAIISYTLPTGCYATTTIEVMDVPLPITGVAAVCQGLTTTLSTMSGGGTWESSDPAIATIGISTGIVSGIAAGTVVITYTRAGCPAYTTATVQPLPAPIAGPTQVCVGSTIALTDITPGGVWSSSATTYATIDPTSGIVSGILAGSATITYTLPTGCITTMDVTVVRIPPAITGVMQACEGAATTLYNSLPGGTWLSGNPAIAYADWSTGIVSAIAAGTATLSYIHTGCAITATYTVNPQPAAITGNLAACFGLTTTLGNTLAGGTWTSSRPAVASVVITTGVVTGVALGTAIITYAMPTGCRVMATVTVNPVPPSITGAPRVCIGLTTVLRNSAPGGTWSSSDPGIASVGLTTGVVTGNTTGLTVISYTRGGCPAMVTFEVNPLPGAITGDSIVCAGGPSVRLYSIDTPVGRWSSVYVSVSPDGVVTGFAPGTGTVTYTMPTGCLVSKTISVLPLPAAITGPNYICIGGSVPYSSSTIGGSWTIAGAATIDATWGLVSGVATGTAIITYTVPSGCYRTKTIAVNPLPTAIVGDSALCVGATITLADTLRGGVWTSSTPAIATIGSTTGVVNGVSAGSTLITYTFSNLCGTNSVVRSLTVNPLPFAGVITGPSQVCVGQTVAMTTTGAGGAWGVTNARASISGGGVVTGASVGVDTIIYLVINGCGTATATKTITVGALPNASAITGPNEVCQGATISLNNTIPGGTWSATNARATISALGVVTGVAPGNDTIVYAVANTCGIASASKVITINPLPDAGAVICDTTVCIGATTIATATVAGGVWTVTNANASISLLGSVMGLSAGRDTIIYTVTNVCGIANATHAIEILPLPVAGTISGADSLCPGDTSSLLTASQPGGVWSATAAGIITIADGKVIALGSGADTVFYTVTNSCGSAVAYLPLLVKTAAACDTATPPPPPPPPPVTNPPTVGCSGIGEIAIYPNPARAGRVNVNIYSPYQEDVKIIVTNIIGQKLEKYTHTTNVPLQVQLVAPAGVYFFTAITSHGKCTEKIVLEVGQ